MSGYRAVENLVHDPQDQVIATIHQPTTGEADALARKIAELLNHG